MNKNWLEWMVFVFSAILILSVVTLLALDASQGREHGPKVIVKMGASKSEGKEYRVPLTAENTGDETAEGVMIEATLTDKDGKEEVASFEIAFLPRSSSRHGWVVFTSDPAEAASLEARAVGYEKP